jgi:hypothetical protein
MKYMFFDSARIVEKQEKYEKIRAYDIIDSLEKKNFSLDKMLVVLDFLSCKTDNDFRKAILYKAKKILQARKEKNEINSVTSFPASHVLQPQNK